MKEAWGYGGGRTKMANAQRHRGIRRKMEEKTMDAGAISGRVHDEEGGRKDPGRWRDFLPCTRRGYAVVQ